MTVTDAFSEQFIALRDDLVKAYTDCATLVPLRVTRHDPGDVLTYHLLGIHPPQEWRGVFRVERFVGGGFAGQVYRVLLEDLSPCESVVPEGGLRVGKAYALKLLRPPSGTATRFRNLLFAAGFQAPFAPQVNLAAARTGALWQKLIRRAAREVFGDERAVCDTYATLYDPQLHAYGYLNEWVEGRIWKFEVDDRLFSRWRFEGEVPPGHNCPEYVGKRLFMRRLVRLMHAMGAQELARQYEWWTCKSQPNVLLRVDGSGYAGLTALDFSPGLVLLPVFPMSPADFVLIGRGLARGTLVQFDRGDVRRLRQFVREHATAFVGLESLIDELQQRERDYRGCMPDLTSHGLRVFTDSHLRARIRDATVHAWLNLGRIDEAHARLLRSSRALFVAWYAASSLPFLGQWMLSLWGDGVTRRHLGRCLTSVSYLVRALRADRASTLIRWARSGRARTERIRRLLDRPVPFTLERITLSWLPPALHRTLTEPSWAWTAVRARIRHAIRFLRDPAYREQQLLDEVSQGCEEGMLTPREADRVRAQIKDPYIQKYLRCLAVHVCTLPITQVVMLVVGIAVTAYFVLSRGMPWAVSLGYGTAAAATIQILPVSPGSVARGLYVVYLMIKERDVKNYYIAAPISFLHVLGYLAFPFQMVAHDPALARFLAGRWTRRMVRVIPVFGEHGALLEHGVFDAFFNLPLSLARLLRRHRERPDDAPPLPADSPSQSSRQPLEA